MSIFKMPEEIANTIKIFWSKYLLPEKKSNYIIINDKDIFLMESAVLEGSYSYNNLFYFSPEEYGLTENERLDFWIKVIQGNYSLFFQKFLKYHPTEVDGQIFMI